MIPRTSSDGSVADRPPGLIDTLQAGFNTVNRNVWILSIPIAVDVIFWLGPQVSIGAMVANWLAVVEVPPGIEPEMARTFEETRRELHETFRGFSLLSLLAVPGLGVPSFRVGAPPTGVTVVVASVSNAIAVAAICVMLGLGLAAWFYGLLGQAVRGGRAHLWLFSSDFGRLYAALLGWAAILLVAGLAFGVPVLGLLGIAYVNSPTLTGVIAPILLGVLLWLYIYLFFTTDALFVSKVPPLVAIRHSIAIVRYNLWSALGLIGLFIIISQGFLSLSAVVADRLGAPGVAIAIAGHIYISAGLAAASMTYYKERLERLPPSKTAGE